MRIESYLLFIAVSLMSQLSLGHNTNVTHPLLTLEAIRLIEAYDQNDGVYRELYRPFEANFTTRDFAGITEYPFYWGTWNEHIEGNTWPGPRPLRLYADAEDAEADEP